MEEQENWKPYLYNYYVSNFGKIKNIKTNKLLKLNEIGTRNKKKYLGAVVSLGKKKKYKMIIIHRAVAETFIANPNNLPQVNHIDGDKNNNHISNLEWCTCKENVRHAINNKLIDTKGEKNQNHKLTLVQVNYIKEYCIPKNKKYGFRALARKFNVSKTTISNIYNNKYWK